MFSSNYTFIRNWSFITIFLLSAISVFTQNKVLLNDEFPPDEEYQSVNNNNPMIKFSPAKSILTPNNGWVYRQSRILDPNYTYSIGEYYDKYLNGKIYEEIIFYRGALGKTPMQVYTVNYNNDMLPVSSLTQRFDSQMKRVNYSSSNYTYNASDQMTEAITVIYTDSVTTINSQKTTYAYYPSGLLSDMTFYNYDISTWVESSSYHYEYNTNNLTSVRYFYIWNGSGWDTSSRLIYTYDSNNNMILQTYERFSQGAWIYSYKYESSYDSENRVIHTFYYRYQNNAWAVTAKYEYSYDASNNRTMYYYEWANGSWVVKYSQSETSGSEPNLINISPVDASNLIPGNQVYLDWGNYNVDAVNIKFSPDGGQNWSTITSNKSAPYLWTIPAIESENCLIRYESSQNNAVYSINELPFTIMELYQTLTHATENVQVNVFNNGIIGQDDNAGIGVGFIYKNNNNALFTGGFVIGDAARGVEGMMGSFNLADFSSNVLMKNFTSNSYFDEISFAEMNDYSSNNMFNVSIKQKTYSRTTDDFVFFNYMVTNENNTSLNNIYLGINLDWDIGDYATNRGGYDITRNLIYQYDFVGVADPNYYGVIALNGMVGGSVTNYGGTRVELFQNFISTVYSPVISNSDYRSFISSGPYDIAAYNNVNAVFALVAGSSLAELQSNADLAAAVYQSGVVGVKVDNISLDDFNLMQNYPNPFNPITTIKYSIAKPEIVTLKVYDILGKEISTLVNDFKTAGSYEVNFDASQYSSGMYLYKLTAGNYIKVKKMILMK